MKIIGLIVLLMLITFCGCSESLLSSDEKLSETVVSRDCTNGWENGIEFDDDSVRCGKKGNIRFGVEKVYDGDFSSLNFYLFSDSSAKLTKDSVWILEMDPVKISACKNRKFFSKNESYSFCLKEFGYESDRSTVPVYIDFENEINYGRYFIYSKYDRYKAYCNVNSGSCELFFSCVVQYNGTYNFSMIPNADDAERKNIGCIF